MAKGGSKENQPKATPRQALLVVSIFALVVIIIGVGIFTFHSQKAQRGALSAQLPEKFVNNTCARITVPFWAKSCNEAMQAAYSKAVAIAGKEIPISAATVALHVTDKNATYVITMLSKDGNIICGYVNAINTSDVNVTFGSKKKGC